MNKVVTLVKMSHFRLYINQKMMVISVAHKVVNETTYSYIVFILVVFSTSSKISSTFASHDNFYPAYVPLEGKGGKALLQPQESLHVEIYFPFINHGPVFHMLKRTMKQTLKLIFLVFKKFSKLLSTKQDKPFIT